MPVKRVPVSVSQLCELLGVEPKDYRGIERGRWIDKVGGGKEWLDEPHLIVEDECRPLEPSRS